MWIASTVFLKEPISTLRFPKKGTIRSPLVAEAPLSFDMYHEGSSRVDKDYLAHFCLSYYKNGERSEEREIFHEVKLLH